MSSEIDSIEEEIRKHIQTAGYTTGADYVRVFATLIYQERERNRLLLDQIAELKREKPTAPIGPTIAGAAADRFLSPDSRAQGESEQQFLNRKMDEQDDGETPSEYLARKARE